MRSADVGTESEGGGPPPTGGAAPKSIRAKKGSAWWDTVVVLVVALLLSVLVRTFLVQAFWVPSGSMLPTLQINDRILVSKLTGADIKRGDVVVFADPGGWLPPATPDSGPSAALRSVLTWVGLLPTDAGDDLVKRVVGLPGDHVVCCDVQGRIQVNGVSLDEPYLAPGGTDQVRFNVLVPAGRIFVLGDNRARSEDSRYHLDVMNGTVPLADVVGPVMAVVWPVSDWNHLSPPAAFATVPAATGSPPASSSSGSSAPSAPSAPASSGGTGLPGTGVGAG
jgi:signal peptidase I